VKKASEIQKIVYIELFMEIIKQQIIPELKHYLTTLLLFLKLLSGDKMIEQTLWRNNHQFQAKSLRIYVG